MKSLYTLKRSIFAVCGLWLCVLVASPASGQQQVQVYTDPARFDLLAKAAAIPIPDSQRVFPGTSCGAQPPVGRIGSGAQIVLSFGSNSVTITNALGDVLCLFDAGSLISNPYGNTEPSFMTANTIVANGKEVIRFVFSQPVQAVAFRLLTNNDAQEVVTFTDASGAVFATVNIDRYTPRNERVFIGFISRRSIKEILFDASIGFPPPGQNEGIEAIKVAQTLAAAQLDQPSSAEP